MTFSYSKILLKFAYVAIFLAVLANGSTINQNPKNKAPQTSSDKVPPPKFKDFDAWLINYVKDKDQIVLLLDYDGTLAFHPPHKNAEVLPRITKNLLIKLATKLNVFIAIITSRPVGNIMDVMGIKKICYAGSAGFEIRYSDGEMIKIPLPPETIQKYETLKGILKPRIPPNASLESNASALAIVYKDMDPEKPLLIQNLIKFSKDEASKAGLVGIDVKGCVLEIKDKSMDWDKGRACLKILTMEFTENWDKNVAVIYVGDDKADEYAYEALKGKGYSFKVTQTIEPETKADQRIPDINSVQTLLKWVEKYLENKSKSKGQTSTSKTRGQNPVGTKSQHKKKKSRN